MNKEKIRIYELSKELRLDNKAILQICSELSIATKSHTSTVSELQAESIRAIVRKDKLSNQDNDPINPIKNHSKIDNKTEPKKNNSSMSQSLEKTKRNSKQEIVAVHKHHRHSNSEEHNLEKKTMDVSQNKSDNGIASSKESSSFDATVLEKQDNQDSNLSLKAPPSRLMSPSEKTPPQDEEKQDTRQSNSSTSESKKKVSKVEKPKLNTPSRSITKPKLKTNKGKNQSRNKKRSSEEQDNIPTNQRQTNNSQTTLLKDSISSDSDKKEFKVERPKPILQTPPPRPKLVEKDLDLKDQDLEEDQDQDENSSDSNDNIDSLLLEKSKKNKLKSKSHLAKKGQNKPTGIGKGKSWDEEEEIDTEKKGQKSSNKGKRKPVIIDDDDDFEDLANVSDIDNKILSKVLARPESKSSSKASINPPKKASQKPKPNLDKKEIKSENKYKPNKQTIPSEIILAESLTLRQLAELLNTPETDIIKKLFFQGIAVNITQTLDFDTAKMVAEDMGVKVTTEEEKASAEKTEMLAEADLDNLHQRPPVVTIMGHVDHGKTTLLDSIRQTKVAEGEAGGITQHIGAYHVDIEHESNEKQIVFLDTPGHEAFTAMRARGTKITDIAVLVVAADDGVRPQTKEAISHAKAAQVPIVVAINKIDKPGANPDRVKNELMELGLVPEDWGGETVMVPVSALNGENLDSLLDMIILVAEMEQLSANPDRPGKGTVIEAHLDRARGPVASLLVQNGTLRVGDIIVAGSVVGKIRAMIDDRGHKVEVATPSFAVEILGLNEVPAAGDEFDVYSNEKEAKAIAEERTDAKRTNRLEQALSSRRISLSTLSEQASQGELKELNLVIKADVQGSVEAILGSLKQLPQKEVQIRVLLSSPGEITETDVDLAAASGAVIVGFNTLLSSGTRQAAEQEGVDIREYNVIYKLLDDIEGAMEGLLDPEEVEENLGLAEVRAVFAVGRGTVAGCYVQSGKLVRNRFIRVRRQGNVLYEGNLDSLRRIKDDVKEVNAGYECGISSSQFNDWQEGDSIEAYEMAFKRRTLSGK